jgi:hypothetical protein
MDTLIRTPYQGVTNIIRFNWHFYVAATGFVVLLLATSIFQGGLMFWFCILLSIGIVTSTFISLFVSYYVYDRSDLYDFHWLRRFSKWENLNIVNIHAGFDETSAILKRNFPDGSLQVFDFYDPEKHTEVSIERARKAYPPFDGTVKITTSKLPISANTADIIFNIFALHEIRDGQERIQFLAEQVGGLTNGGRIVVVEHLRDLPNFLAYTIGFLHFFSAKEWANNFQHAGLAIENEFKITAFITVFILRKLNGNTP